MTGATGFLGTHILHALLAEGTVATVHCLVRRSLRRGGSGGDDRLLAAWRKYSLPEAAYREAVATGRVRTVHGDLGLPHFGLDGPTWAGLCASVDLVLHNGAVVNWLCDYHAARPANVVGTQEALRLATTSRVKHFHYVSTISTSQGAEEDPLETASLHAHLAQGRGYVASKWVAEHVSREACAASGVPFTIYRPGMVSVHSRSGSCNPSDYVSRLLASMAQLKATVGSSAMLDVTPVDYVAAAIAVVACAPRLPSGRTYHLVHPAPLTYDALGDLVRAACGPVDVGAATGADGAAGQRATMEPVAFEVFVDRAAAATAGQGSPCALRPLAGYLKAVGVVDTQVYECTATVDALAALGVRCPGLSAAMVAAAIRFLL